ncbi:MAG: ribonuclease P protein component 4 [Candidatus Methanoplasma sp.]|jgi:ribonuclease P protein subunit RPR2|nr:ribonuclease P protein component 4 [Candidatus Methanoplasma sp.]
MSKRRISKNAVVGIGEERISILAGLSADALREGREDHARRYVSLARSISRKTKAKIPAEFRYCKKCLIPLVPGINCTVRLTGKKIVTGCQNCGGLRRMPYIEERRK